MTIEELSKYISDGVDRAKEGKALEVWTAVASFLENGSLPERSHYASGWIIYYALHQSDEKDILNRKRLLAAYLKLRVKTPHKLHSMILTEALRLYKDAKNNAYGKKREERVEFSISKFIELWDTRNLRPGDWKRKEADGKILSSTAEKLITLWTDETSDLRLPPTANLVGIIDHALSLYPDSPTLLYQRAGLSILMNKGEEAIPLMKKAILLAPLKYYLHSRLAMLISSQENLKLHISLLYSALAMPGPEQFKGKIRLSLAQAWISVGAYPQALYELMLAKHTYELNNWHLSPSFLKALKEIPQNTVPEDPTPAYRKVAPLAEEYIFEDLPDIEVKKTYHKDPSLTAATSKFGRPAAAWRVTDSEGNNYWLQPQRFRISPELPLGTLLKIKVSEGKPVKARLCEPSV